MICFRARVFTTGLSPNRKEVRSPQGSAYNSSRTSPFASRQKLSHFSSIVRSCLAPKLKSSSSWTVLRETDTRGFACMRRPFDFMKLRVVFVCGHFGSTLWELEQEAFPVGELVSSTMEVARHRTRLHGCSRVSVKLWISAARAARVWRKASKSASSSGDKAVRHSVARRWCVRLRRSLRFSLGTCLTGDEATGLPALQTPQTFLRKQRTEPVVTLRVRV